MKELLNKALKIMEINMGLKNMGERKFHQIIWWKSEGSAYKCDNMMTVTSIVPISILNEFTEFLERCFRFRKIKLLSRL